MTLRPSELEAACAEAARALAGAPVQKVVQPSAESVVLGFPRGWLRIDVSPRAGRVHLDAKPPATGEAAPSFCMLLRKELGGARLEAIGLVPGERACRIDFARRDGPAHLLVLLYGAGAKLALTDGDGRQLGAIGPGRTTPPVLPPPRPDGARPSRFPQVPIGEAIAAHYAGAAAGEAKTRAETAARRAIDKLERRASALEGDLARVAAAAGRRRHADLLLAHLAQVPRGASEVTLADDFADGAPVTIALDPARSASDNAARLYKEHKRLARGRARIEGRLEETRAELLAARRRLDAGEMPPVAAPRPARIRGRPASRPPYRRYRSASGVAILVGRGAEKNDQLTFHVARGDDLWLHTRDFPGAHVVVALGGRPLDGETLLDAATLAVHHSPARGEAAADVTYLPRKLVRKPRGAKPGLVTLSGGKTIYLRVEPARLARLLATLSDEE